MKQQTERMLYIDEQAAKAAGYCETCLGALYAPSMVCLRCRRDVP